MKEIRRKEMQAVEVIHDGEHIWLSQAAPVGADDDAMVMLSPEQVPLVIKWLREAARDIQQEGALSEH